MHIHTQKMEQGYDFVRFYVNSDFIESYTGVFDKLESQYVYRINKDKSNYEICLHTETDESIVSKGYILQIKMELDSPKISKWSNWDRCHI